MNPQLSKHNTVSCPVCSQDQLRHNDSLSRGLLMCCRCHGRLVVSSSGTYVRDPFTSSQGLDVKSILQRNRKFSQLHGQNWDPIPSASGLKFLGGIIMVLLLWAGLYRLSTMSNILKSAPQSSQTSVWVKDAPVNPSQTPARDNPSDPTGRLQQ